MRSNQQASSHCVLGGEGKNTERQGGKGTAWSHEAKTIKRRGKDCCCLPKFSIWLGRYTHAEMKESRPVPDSLKLLQENREARGKSDRQPRRGRRTVTKSWKDFQGMDYHTQWKEANV